MEVFRGRLPTSFKYAAQDNICYYNVVKELPQKCSYLYADSATSCIIVIVIGIDKKTKELSICMAHLSRKTRFEKFFEFVFENMDKNAHIYAQGANPCSFEGETASTDNVNTLMRLIELLNTQSQKIYNSPFFSALTISVGQGDPNKGWGCYGVSTNPKDADYLAPSSRYYQLNPSDRNSAEGVQTLFCMFGEDADRKNKFEYKPEIQAYLHDSFQLEFASEEIDAFANRADAENFQEAADMTDEQILKKYSSTPDYEPAWFCDTMREAAAFVKNYMKTH